MSKADLKWFAGLFEGEGSIQLVRSQNRIYLRVSVTMTDAEIIGFFDQRWPSQVNAAKGKRLPSGRKKYRWVLDAQRASLFLRDIAPFLKSKRVIEKAQLALNFQGQKQHDRCLDASYNARQIAFWDRMATLNLRGA